MTHKINKQHLSVPISEIGAYNAESIVYSGTVPGVQCRFGFRGSVALHQIYFAGVTQL